MLAHFYFYVEIFTIKVQQRITLALEIVGGFATAGKGVSDFIITGDYVL